MNLMTCKYCGVVFDKDTVTVAYNTEGKVYECPLCKKGSFEEH